VQCPDRESGRTHQRCRFRRFETRSMIEEPLDLLFQLFSDGHASCVAHARAPVQKNVDQR
jgi:hypothetical protein